jgi:hypothetical protein
LEFDVGWLRQAQPAVLRVPCLAGFESLSQQRPVAEPVEASGVYWLNLPKPQFLKKSTIFLKANKK